MLKQNKTFLLNRGLAKGLTSVYFKDARKNLVKTFCFL